MKSILDSLPGHGLTGNDTGDLRTGFHRLWKTWLIVVGIYLASRIPALIGFALAQHAESKPFSFLATQHRWDSWWYLYLAEFGHPDQLNIPDRPHYGPWGFFPAWPMIIRVVAQAVSVEYAVAGAVVTLFFGVALALVVRRFAARYVGDRRALLVVALFLFFPGAVILSLPYTEAAFLFFAVLALDALMRERWIIASVAVFGAASIRSTAVAVLVAVGVQFILVVLRWWEDRHHSRFPLLAALPAVAGVAAFCLTFWYAYERTGRPFIWLEAQRQWDQTLDFGMGLIPKIGAAFQGTEPDGSFYLVSFASLILFTILVISSIRFWRILPLPVIAYSLALLGSILLYSNVGPRPRMFLSVVPLFIPLSIAVTRWRSWILPTVTLMVLAGLSVVFAFVILYTPLHVTA